jgi:hypothetical protein
MNDGYHDIELTLFCLLGLRLLFEIFKKASINKRYIEVYFFYAIWVVNSIISLTNPEELWAFYFVHCTFPISISWLLLFKQRSITSYVILFLLLFLSNYLRSRILIDTSYLLTFLMLLIQIKKKFSLSKRNRESIQIYASMIAVLIVTHLIFMFGYTGVDWSQSVYIDYFIYLANFTYLSSLILIHVQFRRYFTH